VTVLASVEGLRPLHTVCPQRDAAECAERNAEPPV